MERTLAANLEIGARGALLRVRRGAPADVGRGPAPAEAAAGRGRSDTNNQVAGVDEPDLVKTDGNLVFAIADGRLQIVDAWPAVEAHQVATVAVEGTPRRLLLHGGRAVVFSSLPPSARPLRRRSVEVAGRRLHMRLRLRPVRRRVACEDHRARRRGSARPRVLREVTFNGSFLAARRIGSSVHAVLALRADGARRRILAEPVLLRREHVGGRHPRRRSSACAARTARSSRAADLSAWIRPRDVRRRGRRGRGPGRARRLPRLLRLGGREGAGFVSIASLSTGGGRPALGHDGARPPRLRLCRAGGAYRSPRRTRGGRRELVLGGAGRNPGGDHGPRVPARRRAHAAVEYVAGGLVAGRVLSSFSLDEHEGALRVATTIGHSPDPAAHSAVTVLREVGGRLEEVGRGQGHRPGEDIRAVRFDGARGFVVTFKKTDPLFVLDLAEPAAPAIAGELKVPGFSTYLHLVDPTHLLTIGYDASDQGGFAWFTGIQLQLFDVANPATPALADRELIGTRGSTSQAATDHLAFNYFAPKALLALPMVICEGGDASGGYGAVLTFSGLLVYRVRADEGVHLPRWRRARSARTPETFHDACFSWWTDASTPVKRSVFLEDYVLSFTERELRVQDTRALGADLARIDFTAP